MLTFGSVDGGRGFDPLILLLIALIVDMYVGEAEFVFRRLRHPVVIIGGVIAFLDRKLNRESRGEMDRAIRGLLVVLLMVLGCGALGWGVAWLSLNHDFGWVVELLLVVTLVAQRSLHDHVRDVVVALEQGGLDAGRAAVSRIVGRDPLRLDGHGVSRAAIESLAENFNDGVVAPVFWYVLFGFPGLLVYKAVNTMDSMIGHRTLRYRAFGMTAARLDDVLSWIPARLAGLFIVLAALFVPGGRPWGALRIMLRDAGKHRSPNAGWPEAAIAGALGLALAGPRHYAESTVEDPWLGDGTPVAEPRDIRRALYLFVVACLINGAWVGAIAMIRFSPLAGA